MAGKMRRGLGDLRVFGAHFGRRHHAHSDHVHGEVVQVDGAERDERATEQLEVLLDLWQVDLDLGGHLEKYGLLFGVARARA